MEFIEMKLLTSIFSMASADVFGVLPSWRDVPGLRLFSMSTVMPQQLQDDSKAFSAYIAKYGKHYTTEEEFAARFDAFRETLRRLEQHEEREAPNRLGSDNDMKFGLNEMSDWYDHEYGKIAGRHNVAIHAKASEWLDGIHEKVGQVKENGDNKDRPIVGISRIKIIRLSEENIPKAFDWRQYGAINGAVKQGTCGSCWAFVTAAMIESQNKIAGGTLHRLSPQQLIDCASSDATGNMGCDGGHPVWTYEWAMDNKLIQWSEYPYYGRELGFCKTSWSDGKIGIDIKHGYGLIREDPEQLKAAIMKGPVAISVDADSVLFRDYQGGVINSYMCGEKVGHAMLAIGFGHDAAQRVDYVTAKNSWGPDWGENGFVRISLDQFFGPKGICAVLSDYTMATNEAIS